MHGLPCAVRAAPDLISALRAQLPAAWLQPAAAAEVSIAWELPDPLTPAWSEDPDAELELSWRGAEETAIQRDFVGLGSAGSYRIWAGAPPQDGWHNALRWLLPRHLLGRETLVVHSSAWVVDGGALLCVGPSGAGKSTLAERVHAGALVLGDDVNVLRAGAAGLTVEAGVFGQNPRFQGPLGPRFPLRALAFIDKGDATRIAPLPAAEALRRLLAAIMLPAWERLDAAGARRLLALAAGVVAAAPRVLGVTHAWATTPEELTHAACG